MIHQSVFMRSLYLSLYSLVISILLDAIDSPRLGEKPNPNSHNLDYGAVKSGFDYNQGFPYEPSSHMVWKVLYVNSFYILL